MVLSLGSAAVCAVAWYVHQRQMTRVDAAHLLYLPVVLACLWFGWRGLAVAVVGGACLILTHFTGSPPSNPLEHDILRTIVLGVVGGVVAALRQQHTKAQRQARRLERQLIKRRESSEAEFDILNCRVNRQLNDLRAMSEAARKGDAEKEKILDSLAEHVTYLDEEMQVLWANQAVCDRAGLSRDALVGRHCCETWAQTSEPCPRCPVTEAMKTGQVCEGEKATDDGRRWFLKGYPITDERGNVVAALEVTLDITERRRAEQQVLDEKHFSESLINSLPGLFYVLDEEGHMVRWNENLEVLTGYSADEVSRMHALDFFAEPEKQRIAHAIREVFNEGWTSVEARLRTKSGGFIAFHFTGQTTSQDGKSYLVGVGSDVTEREQARQELQRTFDVSSDMVCIADVNTATFTKVNPAFEQTLGYTEAELLGRPFLKFIHPDDVDKTATVLRENLAKGEQVANFENRYRCKDGTYRCVEWTWHPYPAEGVTYAVARDITEAKEARERMAKERNLLHTLVDNLPDAIYVKDRDHRFVLCNDKVLDRIGVDRPDAILGKTDFDFHPRELAEEFHTEEREVIRTGQPLLNRERCAPERTTGEPRWHTTTKLPLRSAQGETIGLVGIGRDITDTRRAQEAYRSLVDWSIQGLIVFQDQGIAFANGAMAEITGYSIDELVAAPPEQMHDFVHPEDRDLVWQRHAARMEGEVVEPHYAFRIIRKDGSVAWLEIHAARIEYQGRPAIQAACMDVSERVSAENALRQSEAQNRALLDAIPDLIFGLDADGTLLNCRAAKDEPLYLPQEEFLGRKVADIFPAGVADLAMNHIKTALETGETQTFEYRLSMPESGLCDCECRMVRCGEQEVLAIVRNITKRKRAERVAETTRNLVLRLIAVRDIREGARLCLQAAIRASSMDCGGVYLAHEDGKTLQLAVHSGLSDDYVRTVRCLPCDAGPGRLLAEGTPIFGKHGQLGDPLSPTQRGERLKATALIPVTHHGRLVACLHVASHSVEEVPDRARTTLETIAAQVGNTLARLRAEEGLRREHSLVTRIMETSPAGITLVNRQGQIVFANACAERILRATKQQITERRHNSPAWQITDYDGEPLPDEQLPFATVLERGEPVYDVRYAIAGPDGRRVLLRSNAAPLVGESGQIDGMVAAIEDVTDKVKSERSLRESEERFRAIYENAVLGFYRTTPEGRILMANRSLVRMLGYASFEELAYLDLETNGYAAGTSRSIFTAKMEAEGQVVGMESAWARRDGTVLFVRENARAVRDEDGNTLYYEGTVEDVTHRKRAEAALIASERNYREIFNATSEAIFIHDPATGAILDVNDAMLRVFGYSYEDALAAGVGGLSSGSPPYTRHDAQRWIQKAVEEGPQRFEWLAKRKSGEHFWMEASLRHTRIGGCPRVLAIARDITERKKAEKQERQHLAELTRAWHANAMGEMASGLAHELNQPLCAIQNYAGGCLRLAGKRDVDMKTLRASIKQIGDQAERAAGIIKRIRGLVGKREPRRTKLDIKALLSDALGMIEKEAVRHDVTVVPELSAGLPKVEADDVEIEQVALNLMRNAIEAMGDERVTERTLTIATSRPEKDTIEVAIKDTGRGLSPKLSGTVFDSFFTTKEKGLGIGLSLSRRIVEAHGGRLWAESEGSSGATFKFTLPVAGDGHGQHRARRLCRR